MSGSIIELILQDQAQQAQSLIKWCSVAANGRMMISV